MSLMSMSLLCLPERVFRSNIDCCGTADPPCVIFTASGSLTVVWGGWLIAAPWNAWRVSSWFTAVFAGAI
jgi:hypothetical protein